MAASQFLPDEMGDTTRPSLITGLGIASFINTGLFLVIYILAMLVMSGLQRMPLDELTALAREQMEQFGQLDEADQLRVSDIMGILHANGVLLMALLLLRTVVRFAGVLGIWKGRRSGFFLYAAAQVAGIFLPHLILPWAYLGMFGPLLALLTTALYGTQLKRLG